MLRSRADYSFTIDCENNTHVTNGGNPTGFFITIKNTGSLSDTIQLSYEIINVTGGSEPDPLEWEANLNRPLVSLSPDQSTKVILNVSTGCGCQIGTTATIRVMGQSVNSPAQSLYIDTFTTRGVEQDLVELEPPNMLLFSELQAGEDVFFSLAVKNPRPEKQAFRFFHTRKPTAWNLTYSTSTFEVEAYSKIDLDVILLLPLENTPGKYTLGFSVQSTNDPYNSDAVEFNVALLPDLSIKTIIPSTNEPKLGEKVTIEVLLQNLGPALAGNFQVNIYDHLDMSISHLIGQRDIGKILGSTDMTLYFNWTPKSLGPVNITVHADPNNLIEEVGNRYFNNVKTTKITVQAKSNNGDGNKDGDGNGSDLKDNEQFFNQILIFSAIGIIIVIAILVFIYRAHRNRMEGSKRTAKKIPLGADGAGRVPPKRLSKSSRDRRSPGNKRGKNGKEKTARKIGMRTNSRRR